MRDRELRERSEPLRVGVLESVWFVQALSSVRWRPANPRWPADSSCQPCRGLPVLRRSAHWSLRLNGDTLWTARPSEAKARRASEEGSVLNTKAQRGRVEQAPNPSVERTANGVRRSRASGGA